MACETCFNDWVSCGLDSIIVEANMPPNTTYTAILQALGTHIFTITTDEDGSFIMAEPYTQAWTPYSGFWTLKVMDGCDSVKFNNNAYCEPYDCLVFEVKNGTGEKNKIGCECPAVL